MTLNSEFPGDGPIYRQLRTRATALILDGVWKEDEAVPSVRRLAAELGLNPLTVLRAYRQLVDEQLLYKRRGRGLYVASGARQRLRASERLRFLQQEWPALRETLARLGLSAQDLLPPDSTPLGG